MSNNSKFSFSVFLRLRVRLLYSVLQAIVLTFMSLVVLDLSRGGSIMEAMKTLNWKQDIMSLRAQHSAVQARKIETHTDCFDQSRNGSP